VYAFSQGRPVDAFMGAVPPSEIKAFMDKLLADAPLSETDELLAIAKESLDMGDLGAAAQAFAQVLQAEPDNLAAIGGLARSYLASGDQERAGEVAAMAPAGAKNADLDSVRAALALAANAPSDTGDAERRLAADADDHDARMELAMALAGKGKLQPAADHLLTILARDRDWKEGAAKAELLKIFEAAGPMSEIARQGRKKMASILFS
jgi:putative thioredoxin